ncbi:MAG: glycosyltransferase [Cyanobacteria bacterium J06559_1]
MAKRFKVNVVTGQGGGGHYATYRAIAAIAQQQTLPWDLQVTDMDEIITGLSQAGEIQNAYESFGFSGHDLYNLMVKGGWTWLWPLKMRMNKLLVKLNHSIGVKIFTEHWQTQKPDLVVSVMPLYNKGLYESLQLAHPGTPYITVLTDFADCPPAFWFDPEAENTLVCPSQQAVAQARSLGISSHRIVKSSGLVVHPSFYNQASPSSAKKMAQLQALGLEADIPTGMVMFGGNGSTTMVDIAQQLETLGNEVQLIFMCGRNTAVADVLKAYGGKQKRAVVGFTDDMASYMQLSDFFIGKPGNVSVSEALVMNLPVITECNWQTMRQEKYCAQWVKEADIGIVVSSFKKEIAKAVMDMIQPSTYTKFRRNVKAIDNRAVFEVAELIQETLLQAASAQTENGWDAESPKAERPKKETVPGLPVG